MMSYWNQSIRSEDRKDDTPPYSRIFVVCSKQMKEEDLKDPFSKYGEIQDLYMPRDRNSGDSKGIAFIKYSKTSSAAAAIQELNLKTLTNTGKPIKVMVATNKNDSQSSSEDKYRRLFIKVHKEATENEIRNHFSVFGKIDSVHLQRDRHTDTCKGFAYVQYKTFLDAANAFENCDKKYKPVFATPKDELKRSRNQNDNDNHYSSNTSIQKDNKMACFNIQDSHISNGFPQGYNTISVICQPQVPQKYIERIFNIIPGMQKIQFSTDGYNCASKAFVTYEDKKSAALAVDKLHNFEFPSGETLIVKPDDNPLSKAANNLNSIVNNFKNALDSGNPDLIQLADAIAQASTLIKVATSAKVEASDQYDKNYCSVNLPNPQPLASSNSRVSQRCFIVCKPQPPPLLALKDVFCRFGDLIDVSTFPNKTFGFAKYASVRAAQDAINTLNGAIVCGSKLKVMEADEKPSKDDDNKMNFDSEQSDSCDNHDNERKRIKLDDRST